MIIIVIKLQKDFFILSFFVGLLRLTTIRLSAWVGAHIQCRFSRSRGEDVRITYVIIKILDRKLIGGGGVNDVMPRSDELRILGDF